MASPNLTDLVVSTARKYIDRLSDNVSNDNGLFQYLKKNGSIQRYAGGGRTVVEPLLFGQTANTSVQWYTDYDAFTPQTAIEVLDGSEWQWKQLGGFVAVSGREKMINRSDEQRFEFIKFRTEHLQAQLTNTFATALYSTGTGSGGKELGGLQLIVADDPTAAGTVGGINQVTNTFWRNKFSPATGTTSSTITGRMNSMWLAIKRGKDVPTLWVADDDMFGYYEASLQGLQRITSSDEAADAGMPSYRYKGKPFIYDDQCPNKHLYALNLNDIKLRIINDRMFEVGDKRTVTNADYDVVPVFTMATLTTGRRASHGVIIAS
jgi:hypothetical protein